MEFHTISASQWPGAFCSVARWRSARGSGALDTVFVVEIGTVSMRRIQLRRRININVRIRTTATETPYCAEASFMAISAVVIRFYTIVLGILLFDGALLTFL